uniref:Carrier domain-containing protein n=1 Tax=Alexandrium catenella TaxID=2925 RepID=A0A7S1RMV0_ALECA
MAVRSHASRSVAAMPVVIAALVLVLMSLAPAGAGPQPAQGFAVGASRGRRALGALGPRGRSPAALAVAGQGVVDTVSDFFAEQLNIDTDLLTRDAELMTFTELGIDSVEIAESMLGLEDAFNIRFGPEELASLKKVGEIADLIQSKL